MATTLTTDTLHDTCRPYRSPTPEQIREARRKAGQTQAQAGAAIYATRRTWQNWEAGERSMHPALFELYVLKTSV